MPCIFSTLASRSVPRPLRLWASKGYCEKSKKSNNNHEHVDFKKLTELTAEVITSIGEVEAIDVSKVIVLFDRFYLCDVVANACKNNGFTYIGAVKENRNFFPDGRPHDKRKMGKYTKNVLDREGRWVSISQSRESPTTGWRNWMVTSFDHYWTL